MEMQKQGEPGSKCGHHHRHRNDRNQQGPGMAEEVNGIAMEGLKTDGEYLEKQASLDYGGNPVAPIHGIPSLPCRRPGFRSYHQFEPFLDAQFVFSPRKFEGYRA